VELKSKSRPIPITEDAKSILSIKPDTIDSNKELYRNAYGASGFDTAETIIGNIPSSGSVIYDDYFQNVEDYFTTSNLYLTDAYVETGATDIFTIDNLGPKNWSGASKGVSNWQVA
jgi:hypothetical protein